MEFTGIEALDLKISCVLVLSHGLVAGNPFMRNLFLKMVDVANISITLTKEHPDCALLIRAVNYAPRINCLSEAVRASSHSHDVLYDSIANTVQDFLLMGPWISQGRSDPLGTEWLMYRLTELSLVDSIKIYFEPTYPNVPGSPVYGARSVRFMFGDINENVFSATYATHLFPMTPNRCQKFSLNKPLICIEKFLVIEFHDPVISSDGLYHIGVSYIRVNGRDLGSSFRARVLVPTGDLVLEAITYMDPKVKTELDILDDSLRMDDDVQIPKLVEFLQHGDNNALTDDSD